MSAPTRNAVVVQEEPPAPHFALRSPIAKILRSDRAKALVGPKVGTAEWERVIIEAHRAAASDPRILKCTRDSIITAVDLCAESGLVVGKTIYLVPVVTKIEEIGQPDRFENRLDAWTDYKGDIELVVWSGAARHVDAQVVYQGDFFQYELGSDPFVIHRPQLSKSKRGAIVAAYSIAFLNNTGTLKKIAVVSIEEIEEIRKDSEKWNPSLVHECPPFYAKKTAVHANCRALPKNRRLAKVLALFDRQVEMDRGRTEPVRSEAWLFPLPFGPKKGTPIGMLSSEELAAAREHARKLDRHADFLVASDDLIDESIDQPERDR